MLIDWHGSHEVPESLKVFAKELEVDVNDEIIDDDTEPQKHTTGTQPQEGNGESCWIYQTK